MVEDDKIFQTAEAWLKEGHSLREQLTAEKRAIQHRLAEIERYLSSLPPAGKIVDVPLIDVQADAKTPLPELLTEVLKQMGRPLKPHEIIPLVQHFRPTFTAEYIYSTLYRMAKKKRLRRSAAGSYTVSSVEAA